MHRLSDVLSPEMSKILPRNPQKRVSVGVSDGVTVGVSEGVSVGVSDYTWGFLEKERV